eukprot:jgi/Botrbrau1/8504/Bobra.0029s0010.2
MSHCSSCLPLRSLNHISRVCKDVEVTAKFYEEVLGFYKVKRPSSFDFDGYWLFNYNIGIHLIAGEPLARPRELNPRADHMSFQADNLMDVEERLKAFGIPTVKANVMENGICITQVFFKDPDGNMIEVSNATFTFVHL